MMFLMLLPPLPMIMLCTLYFSMMFLMLLPPLPMIMLCTLASMLTSILTMLSYWPTIFRISFLAASAFSSSPVMVISSWLSPSFFGSWMFTLKSSLSLVITAPFLPMILGWYSGATQTLTTKLFRIFSSFSASSSASFSARPTLAASTLLGTPEMITKSDLASWLGTLMFTS